MHLILREKHTIFSTEEKLTSLETSLQFKIDWTHAHTSPKIHVRESMAIRSKSLDEGSMYENTLGTWASSSSAKNFSVQSEGDSHKICSKQLYYEIAPLQKRPYILEFWYPGLKKCVYLAACCVAHVHEVESEAFDDGLVCRIRGYVQLSFLSLTQISDDVINLLMMLA
jgi:hypothetical protein